MKDVNVIKYWYIWWKVTTKCDECLRGRIPHLNGSEYWHRYGACNDQETYIKFKTQIRYP